MLAFDLNGAVFAASVTKPKCGTVTVIPLLTISLKEGFLVINVASISQTSHDLSFGLHLF